jgi:methylmalonyl-CoA/ethylmalonyl-CoA epimerase
MTDAERSFFGPGARLHHVGIGVPSIRAVDASLETVPDPNAGVTMAFLGVHGVTLELVEPLGERSPIARNVREGTKFLHLCFEVPDLEAAMDAGRKAGFLRVQAPVPRPVYEERRVAWMLSRDYGLYELLERKAG